MIQLSLPVLAGGLARSSDPETSHEAAAKVPAATIAELVHADLKANGDATMHQVADRLGIGLVTVSPRFAPLQRAGRVEAKGKEGGRTVWHAI